jgi:hypothetical protein
MISENDGKSYYKVNLNKKVKVVLFFKLKKKFKESYG